MLCVQTAECNSKCVCHTLVWYPDEWIYHQTLSTIW